MARVSRLSVSYDYVKSDEISEDFNIKNWKLHKKMEVRRGKTNTWKDYVVINDAQPDERQ